MKPKSLAASFHSELDEFVDNLDDLSTHGGTPYYYPYSTLTVFFKKKKIA
jgi:hypothetical protein